MALKSCLRLEARCTMASRIGAAQQARYVDRRGLRNGVTTGIKFVAATRCRNLTIMIVVLAVAVVFWVAIAIDLGPIMVVLTAPATSLYVFSVVNMADTR